MNSIPDPLCQVLSFDRQMWRLEIEPIRKPLDTSCLMWGDHPAAERMNVAPLPRCPEARRDRLSRSVPMHAAIHCRISRSVLMAIGPLIVREIEEAISE